METITQIINVTGFQGFYANNSASTGDSWLLLLGITLIIFISAATLVLILKQKNLLPVVSSKITNSKNNKTTNIVLITVNALFLCITVSLIFINNNFQNANAEECGNQCSVYPPTVCVNNESEVAVTQKYNTQIANNDAYNNATIKSIKTELLDEKASDANLEITLKGETLFNGKAGRVSEELNIELPANSKLDLEYSLTLQNGKSFTEYVSNIIKVDYGIKFSTHSIIGIVNTPDKASQTYIGVPNVSVTFKTAENKVYECKTDADGKFQLNYITAGVQGELSVDAENFSPWTKQLTVNSNQILTSTEESPKIAEVKSLSVDVAGKMTTFYPSFKDGFILQTDVKFLSENETEPGKYTERPASAVVEKQGKSVSAYKLTDMCTVEITPEKEIIARDHVTHYAITTLDDIQLNCYQTILYSWDNIFIGPDSYPGNAKGIQQKFKDTYLTADGVSTVYFNGEELASEEDWDAHNVREASPGGTPTVNGVKYQDFYDAYGGADNVELGRQGLLSKSADFPNSSLVVEDTESIRTFSGEDPYLWTHSWRYGTSAFVLKRVINN